MSNWSLPMRNVKSHVWQYRLFNSQYFDVWLAISYLHRYQSIGMHEYVCRKLRHRHPLVVALPQLVHIMLFGSSGSVSLPVLNLLVYRSGFDKRLASALYFYLRSILNALEGERMTICRSLMCETVKRSSEFRLVYVRMSHRAFRTRMIGSGTGGRVSLGGILVHFVNVVSWRICPSSVLRDYVDSLKIPGGCSLAKVDDSSNFSGASDFRKNIIFLNNIAKIAGRLKMLPKSVQQRALEAEAEALKSTLPAYVHIPFLPRHYVLSVLPDCSKIIGSATSSPFILSFELAYEICDSKWVVSREMQVPLFLLKQLNSLIECGISETRSVREGVIERMTALEDTSKIRNLPFDEQVRAVHEQSRFRELKGYTVASVIVKSGEGLRREMVALQIVAEMKKIWGGENSPIWVRDYGVFPIAEDVAIIERITDAESIHAIKKRFSARKGFTLDQYFEENFRDPDAARDNFMYSLVGYSLVTYVLQLKDRHNCNILIDSLGHVIHVDFSYVLGLHPGLYNVEKAPFKFSKEYGKILGGRFPKFRELFLDGFLALRRCSDRLCKLIEVVAGGPTIGNVSKAAALSFKERFKLDMPSQDVPGYVGGTLDLAINSVATGMYDSIQYYSNGYL